MKTSLLFATLLAVATALAQNNSQSGSFLLTGQVKNNKTDSFGIFLTDFLKGTKANIALGKEGAFHKTMSIEGAQNLWLLITGYAFELYVQSGDTVMVNWDAKDVEGTLAVTSPNKQRGAVFALNLALRREGDFLEGLQPKIINGLSRQQLRRPGHNNIMNWETYLAAQRFDSLQKGINDTIEATVNGAFTCRVQFIYKHLKESNNLRDMGKFMNEIYFRLVGLLYPNFLLFGLAEDFRPPVFNATGYTTQDLFNMQVPMPAYYEKLNEGAFLTSPAYRFF